MLDSVINFEAPFDWTVEDWSGEIARIFNASVKRECQVLRGWFSQFDGSRSEMKSMATRAERNEDRVLLAIYMDPIAETQVCYLHARCNCPSSLQYLRRRLY